MMNIRIIYLLIISLLILSCLEKKNNIENVKKVIINDTQEAVLSKMESEPDNIISNNTIYFKQKKRDSIITYIYETPFSSSSDIQIHFYKNKVLYIYHDL